MPIPIATLAVGWGVQMRFSALLVALSALASFPAAAQAPVIMILPVPQPKSCFDVNKPANPKWVASASIRAEKAFQEYLAAAVAKASLKKLFLTKKNWSLDGNAVDAVNAVDPWADRVQRVERTNLIVSNGGNYVFRAVWNAYDASGQLLGRYDAWLQSGRGSAFFVNLDLYSPNSTATAPEMTPFCNFPGDIQLRKAQAEQEAAKKRLKADAN